jgi:hypothetical protein
MTEADAPTDVFAMTPEQATAALDKMTIAYRGAGPSATPKTAAEAGSRLAQLTNDTTWSAKFWAGNPEARAEFDSLTKMASTAETARGDFLIETTTDGQLRRADYEGLIAGQREFGLSPEGEQHIRDLDAGYTDLRPTSGDAAACKLALDKLMRDAGWRQLVLDGDLKATNTMAALNRMIALAADDGLPAHPSTLARLVEMGVR